MKSTANIVKITLAPKSGTLVVLLLLAVVLTAPQTRGQSTYTPYTFTTLAGTACYGSADGTGCAARFALPCSVAADSAGNVYVADTVNGTVRKITPGGIVSTLAGTAGIKGSANDTGSAARFFYCAKASKRERDAGCEEMEYKLFGQSGGAQGALERGDEEYQTGESVSCGLNTVKHYRNHHPTVKPLALTEYLARLILPPAEYAPRRILVPFSGSGSEMIGAHRAGWDDVVGVEMDAEYCQIAEARMKYWTGKPVQLKMTE